MEIVPVCELPPAVLFTSQVIAVLDDPVTVAENVCVWPSAMLAVPGLTAEIATVCAGGGVVEPPPPPLPPPHDIKQTMASEAARNASVLLSL